MSRTASPRRLLAAGAALIVAGSVAVTAPALVGAAGTGTGTGTGTAGQTLTVTPVDDLDPAGETVTVTGSGFDADAGFDTATEGLYVAFCVDTGTADAPSPCVGGIDMSGESGSSRWVTNNPYPGTPSVAVAADGSFTTTIVVQQADENVDCADLPAGQECKVVVRMDHRAGGDRSQDVKVPVTFGDGEPEPEPDGASLTVEPATNLDPDGADVTVTGSGFPTTAPGLYVVYGPPPVDNLDSQHYGALAFVPSTDIEPDGSFSVGLSGLKAAYTDGNDVDHDFSDGGGFVSTMRAHGTPDVAGEWETSVPVSFAGAAVPSTTTSLIIAPTTVRAGTPVVATATVETVDGSTGARAATRAAVTSGTVELLDGTTSLGTATLGPDGRATRTATFTTPGTHTVTARFTGTAGATASTSAPVAVTVTAADPGPGPDPDPDPTDVTPSGTRTGTGAAGQTLTATPVDNLAPSGTEVEVRGAGFTAATGFDLDEDGLYVSFCVDRGAGTQPTPCVGGVDMEGASGSSQWVTNNPYQGAPSVPIADDGSFTARITVMARDEFVDCLDLPAGQRCVIVARTDHRATADRSQDVKVPVCFAGEAACATDPIDPTDPGSGGSTPFGGYPLAGGVGGSGSTPRVTPGGLAATGFAGRTLVPAGLALLGGGVALVLVARRQLGRARVVPAPPAH
jgi:hypothetical protein